jgi:formate hydrogenlyase subunit 4
LSSAALEVGAAFGRHGMRRHVRAASTLVEPLMVVVVLGILS